MAFGDEIQLEAGASGNGLSLTETFTSTPTEGNLLIAWAMTGDGTLNAPTGWSTGVYVDNTTEADVCAVYYKIAGAAESTTVTVTSSASDEWVVNIAEYEGPWDSSPVDLSEAEARDAASPSTYVVSPTGNTAVADELAALVIYKRNPGGGFSFSDSFLQTIDKQSTNKRLGGAAKVLTATGGVTCTVTIVNTAITMGGMVTFKKGSTGVTGSSAQTLANFVSSAIGKVLVKGSAGNTLADFISNATGSVGSAITGSAANILNAFISSAVGKVLVKGSAANTLASFISNATGAVGSTITGTAANILAAFTSSAVGKVLVKGSAANTLASFISNGSGILSIKGSSASGLESVVSSASGQVLIRGSAANTLADFISFGEESAGGGDVNLCGLRLAIGLCL